MRRSFWAWPLAALAGCGWFADDEGFFVNRSDDYIEARQGPELIVPEDLDPIPADPFPVPPIPAQQNARFYPGRTPLPDAIYAMDNRDEVRMQRLGDRIWLVVPEPPATVWPKIKQFFAENGVGIAADLPGQGRLATEWLPLDAQEYRDVVRSTLLELRAAEPEIAGRDRLLLRVEQGLRELTTEVQIRHQNDAEPLADPDPAADLEALTSRLPEAERTILNELGAYIAARVAEQTVSMVAREIAGQEKASLGRDAAGHPVLRLHVSEARAWATLQQALANAQAEVLDIDRQAGACRVSIPESLFSGTGERGFFGRIFSSRSDEAAEVLIRVRRQEDGVHELSVQSPDGQPVADEFGQQVLVLIREHSA